MQRMLSMRDLKPQDLQGLSPDTVAALAAQMLEHIRHQASELQSKGHELELQQKLLQRKRSANPSFISAMNLRIFRLGNQRDG